MDIASVETDSQELLREYAQHRSAEAFAQLVRRYAGLVHATALRRARGDAHLAEDVTQAVFLILSQRAAAVKPPAAIAGWLVMTTRYTASNAMRMKYRRERHEHLAAGQRAEEEQLSPVDAQESWPLLDEAIDTLGTAERDAVLMRYFEGQSVAQIAAALRIPHPTAAKRLARGLAKLRAFFGGRKLDLSEQALGVVLGLEFLHAAPEPVVSSILSSLQGGTSTAVSALAKATTVALAIKKVAVALSICLASLILGIGTVLALQASPRPAAKAPAPAKPASAATGRLHLTFTERSPLSAADQWKSRETTGTWDFSGSDYNIAGETFEVYVPRAYKPSDRPYGLFVWIAAAETGQPPDLWTAALDRTRLIWISANNTGNNRQMGPRAGLALDAVHNMKQRYNLDADRIYIGGFSGGAMVGSVIFRGFPDVFTGSLCMMGGDFYFPNEDPEAKVWPTVTWLGSEMPFEQAKHNMRLVLLTADSDTELRRVKACFESFRLDDFERVTYLQVPGLGHQLPNGSWFEKAVTALDKGRLGGPASLPSATATTVATTLPEGRFSNRTRPLPKHDPAAQAQRLLTTARSSMANNRFDDAKAYAQRILDEYPDTPSVADAKLLIDNAEFMRPFTTRGTNLNSPAMIALFEGRSAESFGFHDVARLHFEQVMVLAAADSREAREAKAWTDWMQAHPQAARTTPTEPALLAAVIFQNGMSYSRASKPDEAKACYQRVIREYPSTPAAAAAKRMLQQAANPQQGL